MNNEQSRSLVPALVILAAGILVYFNSFSGPFIYDDLSSIRENPTIRHLWPALSPPGDAGVGGRPVVNLSLAFNYALGGLDVWGYHLFNLIIHLLAGLTLFGVVRRTLLQPKLCARFGSSAHWLALAVALIWTVHPLQTEAVTYVSQRVESLMGLFYLLTLYCFIRGAESERPGIWYALSVAACLCGMASKEVMVSVPLMVLLYDHVFMSGSYRVAWRERRNVYLGLAGTWLALAYLMVGIHQRGIGFDLGMTWWQYALTGTRTMISYLRLVVWPYPLVFDYGTEVAGHVAEVWPYVLAVIALVAATLVALRRWPVLGFAGLWFLGILSPTTSVIPVAGSPMAEHRMYLPSIAVIALVVVGGSEMLGRLAKRTKPRLCVACGLTGMIVVTLGWLTLRRNEDYRSEASIWGDTLAKQPRNARAQCNFGTVLMDEGKLPEAIAHFERALKLESTYAEAHNNLGDALDQAGRVPEAIAHYERAVQLKPDYAEAHNNLGIAFKESGRIQEAFSEIELALRLRPHYTSAHVNLANLLFETGKLDEAIARYQVALQLRPDLVEAHFNLGILLSRTGRTQEAIVQFKEALRIKPDFAPARARLAKIRSG